MKPLLTFLITFLPLVPVAVAQTPCSWSSVGGVFQATGVPNNGFIAALEGFDDGSGMSLYAGGGFSTVGGLPASNIARWSGTSWSAVGPGVGFRVLDLVVFDDGSGPMLFAGGGWLSAAVPPGYTGAGLTRWNGGSWSSVGTGAWAYGSATGSSVLIRALAVGDDGSGPAIYAVGRFTTAGGVPANNIAKWDGSAWSALGSGVGGLGDLVKAIVSFDDGTGPAVFVAGLFSSAGGSPAGGVARWDGSSWSSLGTGWPQGFIGDITLEVFDDGTGPALYASGFNSIGGIPVNGIAKWNGSVWSALGSGLLTTSGVPVGASDLAVFDDGTGPALYAVGGFGWAGGIAVQGMARWDGSSWSVAGALPLALGARLTIFDDGQGPALYAAGSSLQVSYPVVASVARWFCASSISISLTQAGGAGSPSFLSNTNLIPGNEYFNVFSLDICPAGPGTGLYSGLCIYGLANYQFVFSQLMTPLGTPLSHFSAPSSYVTWGPYALPPLTLDAVCIDVAGGALGPLSLVARLVIQ